MTHDPLPDSRDSKTQVFGKPNPSAWPTLLMILFGLGLFALLLVPRISSKSGGILGTGESSRSDSVLARAENASSTGREVRATEQAATSIRPVGPSARPGTIPGNSTPGGPGRARAGAQPTATADQGPQGSSADPRAGGRRQAVAGSSSAASQNPSPPVPPTSNDPAGQYGIEVASLRITAGGTALDLRYKVLDPEKAARVGREGGPSYILDPEGRRISPRNVQQIGDYFSARHLDRPGRVYSTWFANQSGALRSGDVVGVVMGDLHIADVRVE